MNRVEQESPRRESGLDFLRVAAFLILILYHTGMGFVAWPWHVKNAETSELLEYGMVFVNRWRLPLLFFISGCGVWFSLRRRSFREFSGERLRRLLVPVVFGMFVIVPPQIYFERMAQGAAYTSYAEFYPSVFEFVPYPKGSFSWHHLWFVVYILFYSLVGIPLFAWLRGSAGRKLVQALAAKLERWPVLFYLLNVPSIVVGFWLGSRYPHTHALWGDWENLLNSGIVFLWGFLIASSPAILSLIEKRRKEFLWAALSLTVFFYYLRSVEGARSTALYAITNAYMGFLWVFVLVGWARARVKTGGALLSKANEAVYPFYIAHQTITVAAVYWLAGVPLNLYLKFGLVAALTFAGSLVFYEIGRRTPLTRILIGLKPAEK
jgi:hypothetical protein